MTVVLWLFSILEQNLRYIAVGSESIFRQVEKYQYMVLYNLNTRQLTGEKSLTAPNINQIDIVNRKGRNGL